MRQKRLLVFHPALAPYRIDFFNSLNESFNAEFYFFNKNLIDQKFNQKKLKKQLTFNPKYLVSGIIFKGRTLRFGTLKALRTNKPDIVLIPEYHPIVLFIILWRKLGSGNYSIYTLCDDSPAMVTNVSKFKKKWKIFILRHLTGVIFSNPDTLKLYRPFMAPKTKLLYFPIIQDDILFRKRLSQTYTTSLEYFNSYKLINKKVLLFVGRLVSIKNLQTLISAFKIVVEKDENVCLVLVGSGKEEHTLKTLITKLQLEKQVLMPGRFEGPALLAWYRIAPVFILPSTFEPFGAVVNEALLSGCFCLVSEKAGSSVLIKPHENGTLFNPLDKFELSSHIEATLKNESLWLSSKGLRENKMLKSYKSYANVLLNDLC